MAVGQVLVAVEDATGNKCNCEVNKVKVICVKVVDSLWSKAR
jgi:hypothetical protein